MTLYTNVGDVVVSQLRHRRTNAICTCTALKSNCYVDGYLGSARLPVRLDLQNQLLHFDGYEPYQCLYCQQVYRDVSTYKNHHRQTHPDVSEKQKRIKRDLKLADVHATIENEEET